MIVETKTKAQENSRGADSANKRECHNLYRSVAAEMMSFETQRELLEKTESFSNLSQGEIHNLLTKALWRYTGVPTTNIAAAPDMETIIFSLFKSQAKSPQGITIVGPRDQKSLVEFKEAFNFVSSLGDCSDKEISQAIPVNTEIVLLTNPNPHSGEVYSKLQIKRILASVGSALVIVDESLVEYCNATCLQLLESFDNLVILRTLSEAFGLEEQPLSYALGALEIIEDLCMDIASASLSRESIIKGCTALERQDVMRKSVEVVGENRIYLIALLMSLGAEVIPTPTNFVLLRIANPVMILGILEPQGVTLCQWEILGELCQFLRIPIGDARYCRGIIATLTRCPREYYSNSKRLLRDSTELLNNRISEGSIESSQSNTTLAEVTSASVQ